jgi:hypothetical protein
MKSIFQAESRDEITHRINLLTPTHQAQWGKMTVEQMVRHCTLCEEYYHGKIKIDRSFIGRFFGGSALKSMLRNEASQLGRNAPTAALFKVTEQIDDQEGEKEKWKSLIRQYESFNKNDFTHWFFGNMSREQLGQFIYKHCDHHLRQFQI